LNQARDSGSRTIFNDKEKYNLDFDIITGKDKKGETYWSETIRIRYAV